MPTAPPIACLVCGVPSEPGKQYCSKHLITDSAEAKDKQQDAWRSKKAYRKLYALAAWCGPHGLRLFILQRDPICKECHHRFSTVVDHIKDHKGDLTLFFDRENCRGLCKQCHDEKTAMEHGFGGSPDKKPAIPEGKSVTSAFAAAADSQKAIRTVGLSAEELIARVRAQQTG